MRQFSSGITRKGFKVRIDSPLPPSPRLENVSLNLDLTDHIGVIGRNASGKRSILQGIARACTSAGLSVERFDFETHRSVVKSNGNDTVSRVLGGLRDNTDIVVRFGLTSVWWRRLRSLSTGELRKVLLARAVSKNPDVLILDRPFDGLDAKSRRSLMTVLEEVSNTQQKKQARPLVQGIKWQERIPVRLVIATHRPAQELSPSIKSVVLCESTKASVVERKSNSLFYQLDEKQMAELRREIQQQHQHQVLSKEQAIQHALNRRREAILIHNNNNNKPAAGADASTTAPTTRSSTILDGPVLDIQRLTVFPIVPTQGQDVLEGKDPIRPLLDRVSWSIHPREVWWLQGENGASKSILLSCAIGPEKLLKLAMNQHANREWTVEVDPEADRRRKRPPAVTCTDSVEMVSTESHMAYLEGSNSETIVEEYLYSKCGSKTTTNWKHFIYKTLVMDLGIQEEALKRRFNQLSTGEQKLVLIGGAILARPRLLILDEPCQSLDLEHRKRVARMVDAICSPHHHRHFHDLLEDEDEDPATACVFVSHHEDELPRSVSHRLVLEKGKVISRGHFHIPPTH